MPGQLRATSKPLEQFLASHFFSPRNTRSTRKEVDKEGDKKVFRRSSTEIFRVFSRVSWANPIFLVVRVPTWRGKPGLASRTREALPDTDRRAQR